MTAVGDKQTTPGDRPVTYFGYLSSVDQLPPGIKSLIDRYDIRIYQEVAEWRPPCYAGTDNLSANNNDDDVEPVQPAAGQQQASPPPPPAKLLKRRVPSLTRRLSKFGKRSLTDKNKVEVESATSPSDSQLATPASAATSFTTVDDVVDLQAPLTSTPLSDQQKNKLDNDLNEQKDKYAAGNYHASSENAFSMQSVVTVLYFTV